MAVITPALASLRSEFSYLAPARDVTSDGWIGDSAHRQNSSDHNPDESGRTPYEDADAVDEVHALDVDKDLRRPGWSMQKCVDIIVWRHRTGQDDRLQNVIYNRRIWSRSWGWNARTYTGTNPHTEHAHFSGRYGSGSGQANPENRTGEWGLLAALRAEEEAMALTEQETRAAARAGVWADEQMATAAGTANAEVVLTRMYRALLGTTDDTGWLKGRLDSLEARLVAVDIKLDALLRDPADMDEPEQHPLVVALRYVLANPAQVSP